MAPTNDDVQTTIAEVVEMSGEISVLNSTTMTDSSMSFENGSNIGGNLDQNVTGDNFEDFLETMGADFKWYLDNRVTILLVNYYVRVSY